MAELSVFQNGDDLARGAGEEILGIVSRKPDAVLCLAAGDTPRAAYRWLAKEAVSRSLDFSRVRFVALDEWIGIEPSNPGSCQYFLRENLMGPLNIQESQFHFFDSLAANTARECEVMNFFITKAGGIDLMLVGVGMNGHVGFNEPGVSADLYAHVITLDETTRRVGQKYFEQSTLLKEGITLGLRHFLHARRAIVMASGSCKAGIMKQVLEGPVSSQVPASLIRNHSGGCVMLDREAASLLTGHHGSL